MNLFYGLFFSIHPIHPNQAKTQVAGNRKPTKILANLKICLAAWIG